MFVELGRVLAPQVACSWVPTHWTTNGQRGGHEDDTFIAVDPDTLGNRLEKAGVTLTNLDQGEYQFRFVATRT